MSMSFEQRLAAWRFKSDRADYYEDLSSLLSSTNRKMLEIFEQDAQRYASKPRGILSTLWADRFVRNGADLAEALAGTLPDAEVAILRVLQNAGDDALPQALNDLATMARLSQTVANNTRSTLTVAVVGVLLALTTITALPIFGVAQIKSSFEIPVAHWGSAGQAMTAWASFVQRYLGAMLTLLAAALVALIWSVNNWTGPARAYADRSITLYKTVRDIAAVRLLITMSTLTRKRGNVMFTLDNAINSLTRSTKEPWARWRLMQLVERIDETGAVSCEVFDTGILSQEIYWRLRDVEEGSNFSRAFEVTAEHVSKNLLPRLLKKLTLWRWLMLGGALAIMVFMMVWVQITMSEMRSAMVNFMSR